MTEKDDKVFVLTDKRSSQKIRFRLSQVRGITILPVSGNWCADYLIRLADDMEICVAEKEVIENHIDNFNRLVQLKKSAVPERIDGLKVNL